MRISHTLPLLLALTSPSIAQAPPEPTEARLLRYPHMQGDKIAFVHGGDIWTASTRGGAAHRVTSFDEGLELFPRISPDGNWIAFSGEYSGTRQIYLVPYAGGEPRQLTFYPDVGPMPPRGGYDHLPIDWTPDGKHVLIRANRTPYGKRVGRYFLVDPWNGGLEQPLQLPEGGPASLSPDGRKLAYNIISREWRTWKRYRAGRAQDVFIYDLDANTVRQITDFEGTDNFPMWLGDRIYFTSDRTGRRRPDLRGGWLLTRHDRGLRGRAAAAHHAGRRPPFDAPDVEGRQQVSRVVRAVAVGQSDPGRIPRRDLLGTEGEG